MSGSEEIVCSQVTDELSAYLDGELPPGKQAEVRDHLQACGECRSEHEGLVRVSLEAESLPRLGVPAHFRAQVMSRVVSEPAAAPLKATIVRAPAAPAKRGASGRVPAAAPAPAAPAPSPEPAIPAGCVSDEDLSALVDEALTADDAVRAKAHLIDCARCRGAMEGLGRVRSLVQGLPRLQVPQGFAARVLEVVAAAERDDERRAQEARAARAVWWSHGTRVARAAGLLALIWVGSSWSAPAWKPLASRHAGHPGAARRHSPAPSRPVADAPQEQQEVVLPEGWDAKVELSSTVDAPTAANAGRSVVAAWATQLAEREDARGWSCVVRLPANQVDDLLRGLVATRELDGGREVEDVISRVGTELDRVELKNGNVIQGTFHQRKDGVCIVSGSLSLEFPQRDVLRVERAGDPRTLRLEVLGRE